MHFPSSHTSFLFLAFDKASWKLEAKIRFHIKMLFASSHWLFYCRFCSEVLGESGRCMHDAIVLKQGLSLLGRFSVTPAKGWRNTCISRVVWHQAIALYCSVTVNTEDMLVSYGCVRKCRAVDSSVVKDPRV